MDWEVLQVVAWERVGNPLQVRGGGSKGGEGLPPTMFKNPYYV